MAEGYYCDRWVRRREQVHMRKEGGGGGERAEGERKTKNAETYQSQKGPSSCRRLSTGSLSRPRGFVVRAELNSAGTWWAAMLPESFKATVDIDVYARENMKLRHLTAAIWSMLLVGHGSGSRIGS